MEKNNTNNESSRPKVAKKVTPKATKAKTTNTNTNNNTKGKNIKTNTNNTNKGNNTKNTNTNNNTNNNTNKTKEYNMKDLMREVDLSIVEQIEEGIETQIAQEASKVAKKAPKKVKTSAKVSKTNTPKKATNTIGNSNIKIIPLGGLEEIGKNMTVFEYEDDMIIVDCGLAFPEDDMLGIDIVIPDFSYVEKNLSRLKGLVITHGHEDHIGAIPYFLKKFDIPVYATPLTAELIRAKLKEHKLDQCRTIEVVHFGDTIQLGKFSVEFIASAHSIPDSAMLAIRTKEGTILHTGDFKLEFTPVDGQKMNLARIGEIANTEGFLALLSDSTNSEKPGYTMSETSVNKVIDDIFENCKKRIIISTFASNVNRVQGLVKLAQKYKRKIAVSGRSMEKVLEIARNLGYIDAPADMFVELDQINQIEDENLLLITTGSQGEPMSALTRIAMGQHKNIKLSPNDLVIISATPIPGNEISVSKVINMIMKRGTEVVYSALKHVHVSGHACQEEQKLILALAKPKYFIPVHGAIRNLYAHRNTAMEMGYKKSQIPITENGKVLEINQNEWKFNGTVESGKTFVDGLGVGDVGNIVIRDRQVLSQDGLIIVVMNISQETGKLVSEPDIISRGFVYVKESDGLLNKIKSIVKEEMDLLDIKDTKEWSSIKPVIKSKIQKYVYKTTKRDPMILPIVVEV